MDLKRQCRRRQYRRIDGTIPYRKKVKIVRLGGKSRRFWRIKAVDLKMAFSPVKLWRKLKNAYVNMMLSFAGNVSSINNNGDFFLVKPVPKDPGVPVSGSKEEFESRLVFEILKTLMASNELGTTTL